MSKKVTIEFGKESNKMMIPLKDTLPEACKDLKEIPEKDWANFEEALNNKVNELSANLTTHEDYLNVERCANYLRAFHFTDKF